MLDENRKTNLFITGEELANSFSFPVLVHSNSAMTIYVSPRKFLWGVDKEYLLGAYNDGEITDKNGKQARIVETKIGHVKLKNTWLNLVYGRKFLPRCILVSVDRLDVIDFTEFKKDKISYALKHKWYGSVDPAFSMKKAKLKLESAENANSFVSFFEAIGYDTMSKEFRKNFFDE